MLLIINARLVDEAAVRAGELAVEQGRIVARTAPGVLAPGPDDQLLDCAGHLVLPGCVDVHVHCNEPGNAAREDFASASAAAAAGGTTTLVDMPVDNLPPPLDAATLAAKRRLAEAGSRVDMALWGGLVRDNVAELPGMAAEGAAGFKAFMVDAGPDFPWVDAATLRRGMAQAAALELPVLVHAEDQELCAAFTGGNAEAFLAARSPLAENRAVDSALALAAETGCQIHLCHASQAGAVRRVARARTRVRASVETCLHYLLFTEADFRRAPWRFKCQPPLRSDAEREGLWDCLLAGEIDLVASDHSPCEAWEQAEDSPLEEIWGGFNSVQATLQGLYAEGVVRRGLPLPHLVRLLAANPSRLAGLYPRKGALHVGSDADMVVLDEGGGWRFCREQWLSRHATSPFIGLEGPGRVVAVLVRGKTVFAEDRLWTEPGFGRCLRRGEKL